MAQRPTPSSSAPRNFSISLLPPNYNRHNSDSNEVQLSTSLPAGDDLRTTSTRRSRRRFTRPFRSHSESLDYSGSNSSSSNSTGVSSSSTSSRDAEDYSTHRTIIMPFKRKASSTPKPGKSTPNRTMIWNSSAVEIPIVKYSDLVRDNPSSRASDFGRPSINSVSNFDEDPGFDTWWGGRELRFRDLHSSRRIPHEFEPSGVQSDTTKPLILLVREKPSCKTSDAGRIRYLPLRPLTHRTEPSSTTDKELTIMTSHRKRIDRAHRTNPPANATWPAGVIPVEMFDLITKDLPRTDVKKMRLVNREFERKVSCSLFYSSVVPFNTEIYDMIEEDAKSHSRSTKWVAPDRGREAPGYVEYTSANPDSMASGLQWQNANEDKEGKVYKGHGLRVFEGFGPHIKKFGMSFDVSEKQLSSPPAKKDLDWYESYHGRYGWPQPQYTRFANLAGLERTADETSRMKAAFSNLKHVQELGLSIDSGLGWLNGPDRSVRSRVFERPSAIFHSTPNMRDHGQEEAEAFWVALKCATQMLGAGSSVKEIDLEIKSLASSSIKSPSELDGLGGQRYGNPALWSAIDCKRLLADPNSTLPSDFCVLSVNSGYRDDPPNFEKYPLIPTDLKKEQKEWLLETEWAQRAFLESYMLAIEDNPMNFAHVTTICFAKFSSRYLPLLSRGRFWDALPCLKEVTMHVSADWRTVQKDSAGFAQTRTKHPSEAVRTFYRDILLARIAPRDTIKKLDVGWSGGGEHAEGIFARNANLLPAPITRLETTLTNGYEEVVEFVHLEHLTLTNCWVTPGTIEGLVKLHADRALETLTLNSVSLTVYGSRPGQLVQQQLANPLATIVPAPNNLGQPLLMQQPLIAAPIQNLATHGQGQQHPLAQGAPNIGNAMPGTIQAHLQNPSAHNGINVPIVLPAQGANQQLNQAPPPAVTVPSSASSTDASHWAEGHRQGSWPDLLNKISPGANFDDFLPPPAPWEERLLPRQKTKLRKIELKSCGYVKLHQMPHSSLDQSAIESMEPAHYVMPRWFRMRAGVIKSAMLESRDRFLGNIVQHMPQRELQCLHLAWGLRTGWDDRELAEQPTYDGFLRGGTGRVSGVLRCTSGFGSNDG